MYFKPVDEMSLRHLFSSDYGEAELRMEYLGPVLNATGLIEKSPDCLILDRRESRVKVLRYEFKFLPASKEDFKENKQFDIAIVWKIGSPLTKQRLLNELSTQNDCHEIIVLSEYAAFDNLKEYHTPGPEEFNNMTELRRVILKMEFLSVVVAFIAAKISPKEFSKKTMVAYLKKAGYPEMNKWTTAVGNVAKGKGNIVGALCMKTLKPPLVKKLHGDIYRWNEKINKNGAVVEIEKAIRENFLRTIPDAETINIFVNDVII